MAIFFSSIGDHCSKGAPLFILVIVVVVDVIVLDVSVPTRISDKPLFTGGRFDRFVQSLEVALSIMLDFYPTFSRFSRVTALSSARVRFLFGFWFPFLIFGQKY